MNSNYAFKFKWLILRVHINAYIKFWLSYIIIIRSIMINIKYPFSFVQTLNTRLFKYAYGLHKYLTNTMYAIYKLKISNPDLTFYTLSMGNQ